MSAEQNGKEGLPLLIIAALCTGYALSLFLRVCITVLADGIESSMGVSATAVSTLASLTLVGYAVMQIPSGIMTDAIGGRKTIILFLCASGLGTIMVGATNSLEVAMLGRFLTGMSIAVIPACVGVFAACVPPQHFGKAMGLLLGGGTFGSIAGGTPLAALEKYIGWRPSLFIAGGLAFALAGLVWFLVKPSVEHGQHREKANLKQIGGNLKEVLTSPKFWPLAIWQTCIPGSFFILAAAWWAKYLYATDGLSKMEFGHIFVVQAIVGVVLLPFCGALSDKLRTRKIFLLGGAFFTTLVMLSFVLLAGKLGFWGSMVQGVCVCLAIGMGASVLQTAAKETFPPRLVGTAAGCTNTFYPIYGALMIPVFGKMVEYKRAVLTAAGGIAPEQIELLSYQFGCWLLVGSGAVGLVAAILVKESYKGKSSGHH